MISHHPSKFGRQGHSGGADIIFLKVAEHDSTCLLKSVNTIYL